jgi:NAD(P)-dependent dehydrogenase (short-subunit alcohol dehydrogenase family)
VRDRAAARAAVATAVSRFGRLDVLVNNAGYGVVGAIEELSEDDLRDQLETNLFGTIWTTQAAVAQMRSQGSGHIVQISTVGGVGTVPLLGGYNASKWALEGYSEALAAEVAHLGIRVTIAELGGFATDWGGSSMRFAAPVDGYDTVREQVFGSATVPWPDTDSTETDGASPDVAAAALLQHLADPDPPLRLLVGDDAPDLVRMALERRRDDYAKDVRFRWPGP